MVQGITTKTQIAVAINQLNASKEAAITLTISLSSAEFSYYVNSP
jgi:hypothetical protein